MGDGACTAIASLTVRVTVDVAVAVGHAMVARRVSEEAAAIRFSLAFARALPSHIGDAEFMVGETGHHKQKIA